MTDRHSPPRVLTRRSALAGAAALAVTGGLVVPGACAGAERPPSGTRPGPTPASTPGAAPSAATVDPAGIREIEQRHDRRVGVFAQNLQTGRTLAHRAEERFVMCSTFKTFAVGALLDRRLVTPDPRVLERRVSYPPSLVAGDIWAPATRRWLADDHQPTWREVAEAAVRDSDNGAANLVLQHIGGPEAVTRLFRDLGDPVSRLDRWEPDLSTYQPGQELDTTTPRALGASFAALALGTQLRRTERSLLLGWLRGNRTDPPFRSVLPAGWTIADKTGAGGYATRNDVGIAWTPQDVPILVSCLTRAEVPDAERLDAPVAEAFTVAVEALR
ncbi:class A beta-lactamase [Nocardioides sp. R1-1]|uniref:class A beta-lactamase n=1 Tax=Nocardioides sp. R1-1 TaxID=3383502 RepID=UPI0038D123B1